MNTHNPATDRPGKRDVALANELGMDIGQNTPEDTEDLLSTLANRDTDPLLLTLLERLLEKNARLQARLDELEATQERTHDVATTARAKAETNAAHLEDVENKHERTHDVAKSAIAKAHQLEADVDHQEDAEALPMASNQVPPRWTSSRTAANPNSRRCSSNNQTARTPTGQSPSPNAGRSSPPSEVMEVACS